LVSAAVQLDGVGIESLSPDVFAGSVDHLFGLGGPDATGAAADLAGTAGADLAANTGSDLATSFVPDFPC
jgi:hypothetical protein